MREALGIDDKVDILGHVKSLRTVQERQIANSEIEEIEEDAMHKMVWSFIYTWV
jgi:hypothetical protein